MLINVQFTINITLKSVKVFITVHGVCVRARARVYVCKFMHIYLILINLQYNKYMYEKQKANGKDLL